MFCSRRLAIHCAIRSLCLLCVSRICNSHSHLHSTWHAIVFGGGLIFVFGSFILYVVFVGLFVRWLVVWGCLGVLMFAFVGGLFCVVVVCLGPCVCGFSYTGSLGALYATMRTH